jgi:transposase
MKIIRQSLGIDISMNKFDCCLGNTTDERAFFFPHEKTFTNDLQGFQNLLNWIEAKVNVNLPLSIAMEATGVYYENLAYFLNDNSNYEISVILPAKVKFYFKSLSHKTKTDKIDAIMLCQYGLERRLNIWKPANYKIKEMKNLSREYRDNKRMINQLKNQLHAKTSSYKPSPSLIKRLKKKIELIEIQCLEIEAELKTTAIDNEFLRDKVEKICSIPGVGFITAISVIAETNGFALIRNAKQLTSYAGLDIQLNDSGNKSGKSRISKKGNRYLRMAVYMPALSASRLNQHLIDFYARVNSKNKCKKVGLIGVSRKLLILIYALWKKDEFFKLTQN